MNLRSGERGSSRRARRTYSGLVAAEVALACALLAGSALLVRTVAQMMDTPLGVAADRTVVTTVQLTRSSASSGSPLAQWQTIADTHARILAAVREQPGVLAAGASNFLPLEIGWRFGFTVQGQPAPANPIDMPQAQLHSVSDGYLEAMGATLGAGRNFTPFDVSGSEPVALVNATFARRYLSGAESVGQRLGIPAGAIGPLGTNLMAPQQRVDFEVVGIVDDIRNVPLGQTTEPAIYLPMAQFPFSDVFVAIDAASSGAALNAAREALRVAAPEVPMGAARSWGDRFGERTAEPRLLMAILVFFGGLAGLLAALGVYGLFSWSVALRTRELAIRLALGARPSGVGGLVVRQSALLVGAGLLAGLLIVRLAESALATVLYEVSPGDVRSLAAGGGLLLLAAMAACIPPALRAMRVNPVEGLRSE